MINQLGQLMKRRGGFEIFAALFFVPPLALMGAGAATRENLCWLAAGCDVLLLALATMGYLLWHSASTRRRAHNERASPTLSNQISGIKFYKPDSKANNH
jgi:hypothetical protein